MIQCAAGACVWKWNIFIKIEMGKHAMMRLEQQQSAKHSTHVDKATMLNADEVFGSHLVVLD